MGKSPLAEEVGIARRGRWSRARASEMADIPERNSVCKVMHGHESGLNARRRTPPPCVGLSASVFVCACVCLPLLATFARYRESRSISPGSAREVAARAST